jgi:predicted negative regulator of RcsB-dependent stress response
LSKKLTKDDVRSPDQVTKTLREGFVWTTGHSKMVLGAIGAFIVVGMGVSLWSYFSTKKETSLQEKYYVVEKAYLEKKRGFEEASRAEVMAAQAAKDKKAAPAPAVDASKKATGDLQKDYGTVIPGFEALIADAPNTQGGRMAALNLADIYASYSKNEEALATLQKVEKGLGKNDAITALVLTQMGNVYSNKGDCKGAIEKWQAITDRKGLAFAHDEAKLRMGLCYESMNDTAKAEQLYTEVSKKQEATADFSAAKDAEKYLRLLKAKKNFSSSGT